MVAIVDSDISICESLSLLFRLEGFETRFYRDLAEFTRSTDCTKANAIILELNLLEPNIGSTLNELKIMARGSRIFITAREGKISEVVQAMHAGAASVVPKPIDKEQLIGLVLHDLRKSTKVTVHDEAGPRVEILGFHQLTDREREVLELLVEGHSNKEAGLRLGISPRTVEVHRAGVMRKLNAKNTADLIRIVLTEL